MDSTRPHPNAHKRIACKIWTRGSSESERACFQFGAGMDRHIRSPSWTDRSLKGSHSRRRRGSNAWSADNFDGKPHRPRPTAKGPVIRLLKESALRARRNRPRLCRQADGQLQRFCRKSESFDIVRWLNFVTFDVIGDLAFGESFGCLERGDFHFWITVIFDAVKAGAIQQATRRFATAGSTTQNLLMNFIPSGLRKRRKDHLAYSKDKVMR